MCAHGSMMSEGKKVPMAGAFVAEMGNVVGIAMDPVTELNMDHYDHSQDNGLVVSKAIQLDQRGKWSATID